MLDDGLPLGLAAPRPASSVSDAYAWRRGCPARPCTGVPGSVGLSGEAAIFTASASSPAGSVTSTGRQVESSGVVGVRGWLEEPGDASGVAAGRLAGRRAEGWVGGPGWQAAAAAAGCLGSMRPPRQDCRLVARRSRQHRHTAAAQIHRLCRCARLPHLSCAADQRCVCRRAPAARAGSGAAHTTGRWTRWPRIRRCRNRRLRRGRVGLQRADGRTGGAHARTLDLPL